MNKDVDIEARSRMIKGIAGLLSDDTRLAGNIQAAAEAIFELAPDRKKHPHVREGRKMKNDNSWIQKPPSSLPGFHRKDHVLAGTP